MRPGMLMWFLVLLLPAMGHSQQTEPDFGRGIAVLASDVGTRFPVEALLEFVDRGRFNPVVIDWAWITLHWERTNFGEVNRLLRGLQARGIEHPAMYRPRFSANPDVPYQQKQDGAPAYPTGYDICFGSEVARAWGAAWGKRILEKCPGFGEIIIYDPRHECRCPACAAAVATDPAAPTKAVWRFMAEARALWRTQKADVKLGVNYVTTDLHFWEIGRDIMDLAYPYLFVYEQTNVERDMAGAEGVRRIVGAKFRPCLAKITWGDADKVSLEKLADFDRRAREQKMPYFLWLMGTPFLSPDLYDPAAACTALGLDWQALQPSLTRMGLKGQMTSAQARALVEEVARTNEYPRLGGLKGANEATVRELLRLFEDSTVSSRLGFVAALALSHTKSPLAVPVLLKHADDADNQIRLGVSMALPAFADGTGEIREVLTDMAESDPWSFANPKTGQTVYPVRENAKLGLARLAKAPTPTQPERQYACPEDGINPPTMAPSGRVNFEDAMAGKVVTLVNLGDVIRLSNTGPALENVEFERYSPAIDSEQIVLGRWMAAYAQDRTPLAVSIAAVREDTLGNFIQTLKLPKVPANQTLVIVASTLVARKERPLPQGSFPILSAEQYPEEVRPFLHGTVSIEKDLPEIQAVAGQLLGRSRDTLEVARLLAALLKQKPGIGKDYEPSLPMAVNVLKHGGSCCASAMTAVSILRACGIPAQITYTSFSSYIHGISRFYLNGYGWLRIETTCSHAKVPLTEREQDLGLVRIYDLTLEGEAASMWSWPYMHFGEKGEYPYRSGGQECKALKVGRYVPGILSTGAEVLGGVPNQGAWVAWENLVKRSREAVRAKTLGEFGALTGLLPETKPHVLLMPAKVPAPKGGRDD